VACAAGYVVAVGGFYGDSDLVPCKREGDEGATCAFLAEHVAGHKSEEVEAGNEASA
jgi:hypothetical protein